MPGCGPDRISDRLRSLMFYTDFFATDADRSTEREKEEEEEGRRRRRGNKKEEEEREKEEEGRGGNPRCCRLLRVR